MTDHNDKYIAMDMAKKNLVICKAGDQKTTSLEKNQRGHKTLISNIKSLSEEPSVVLEATGGYQTALIEHLLPAKIEVALGSPFRVRHFAYSKGVKAKTDLIDAKRFLPFAEAFDPRRRRHQDGQTQALRGLLQHRQNLMDEGIRVTNRLDTAPSFVIKHLKKPESFLEKQIAVVEKEIDAFCQSHSTIKEKQQRLEPVKGMGPVARRTILAYLPEIGSLNHKEGARLAGVAPFNRDRGRLGKPMSLYGGRGKRRSVLYRAAMVAIRHNRILKGFYERLRHQGKPGKVALVAVMRKRMVLANHLMKKDKFILDV